jgi:glucose/arabinose dehydrogenase
MRVAQRSCEFVCSVNRTFVRADQSLVKPGKLLIKPGMFGRLGLILVLILCATTTGLGSASRASMLPTASPIRFDRVAPPPANGASATTGTTIAPAPQKVRLQQIATADQPVGVAMRSNDETIYVIEKQGRIRAWQNDSFANVPVLDISKGIDSDNERGLLGLAFHPNRRDVLYIDYTNKRGDVRVSEVPFDGTTADMTKERNLLDIPKPFNEHNAGTLFFDTSGYLYIGIGDGGGANDKFNNAQRKDVLLGKVLRIDPTPTDSKPYSIPPSNPFVRGTGRIRKEIFAYGLRNPWQVSRDSKTGDLWIPDVGQTNREEINYMPSNISGSNFGWKLREGLASNGGGKPAGAIDPVYDYPHKDGRCAVAGGVMYRGENLRALTGMFFFGDVCSGALSVLRSTNGKWEPLDLDAKVPYLTSIVEGTNHELIATSLEGGIFRLEPKA